MTPEMCYLICASQRSGTTMLCRGLEATGIAGRPGEYFLAEDPEVLPDWRFWEEGPYGVRFGARDRQHYLNLVFEHATTDNGIFGAKLMWNNLRWAVTKFEELPQFSGLTRAEVLTRAFPNLHIVHVLRHDRLRQAISWARAAQDGVWVVSDHEPGMPARTPEYSFELIDGMARQIAQGEDDWRRLFAELDVEPLVLYYEDMQSEEGYREAVRQILEHLQISIPADFEIPPRRTHRQADPVTEGWVERFQEDKRGR